MEFSVPKVSIRYYLMLIKVIEKYDINVSDYYKILGINKYRSDIDLNSEIDIFQIEKLIISIQNLKQIDKILLDFANSIKVTSHQDVGFALLVCQNFKNCVDVLESFFRLILPFFELRVNYSNDTEVDLIIKNNIVLSPYVVQFHMEVLTIVFVNNINQLLVQLNSSLKIILPFKQINSSLKFYKADNTFLKFRYDKFESMVIQIPIQMLNQELPLSDENSFKSIIDVCKKQLISKFYDQRIDEKIKNILFTSKDDLTLNECASFFNMTPSTLHRKLNEINTKFSDLKYQVLISKAKQLLIYTDKSIMEIGVELNFSEHSSFSRAFKSKIGIPPGKFRKIVLNKK